MNSIEMLTLYTVIVFQAIYIGLLIFNAVLEHRIEKLRRQARERRECRVCARYGTMDCPNSSLCWSTDDKPYFIYKGEET